MIKGKAETALFLGLNMTDAILTKECLEAGATEVMPLAKIFGSNMMLWKWLIPLGVVTGLYYKNKMNLLKPLNIVMGAICTWNLVVLGIHS